MSLYLSQFSSIVPLKMYLPIIINKFIFVLMLSVYLLCSPLVSVMHLTNQAHKSLGRQLTHRLRAITACTSTLMRTPFHLPQAHPSNNHRGQHVAGMGKKYITGFISLYFLLPLPSSGSPPVFQYLSLLQSNLHISSILFYQHL